MKITHAIEIHDKSVAIALNLIEELIDYYTDNDGFDEQKVMQVISKLEDARDNEFLRDREICKLERLADEQGVTDITEFDQFDRLEDLYYSVADDITMLRQWHFVIDHGYQQPIRSEIRQAHGTIYETSYIARFVDIMTDHSIRKEYTANDDIEAVFKAEELRSKHYGEYADKVFNVYKLIF